MIKQANPRSNKKVEEKVLEILASGQYVKGPEAEKFEKTFTDVSHTKYNYAVNSGTSALNLIFTAVDYPAASNIIVPANSFMASSNTVETSGYNTKFCDIDPKTMNIDPEKLREVIDEKSKAILVVHLYGNPAPMDEILDIAKEHNLDVFEDAAQAHGAIYKGRKIGSIGKASAFSLFPTKNLSVLGDGGIVCTNDEEFGARLGALRNAGRFDHPDDAEYFGFNYRLSELLAGIGNVLIAQLQPETTRRQEIAEMYTTGLNGVDGLILPQVLDECTAVYHQYTIRTDRRDELKQFLKDNGVGSSVKYSIPLHLVSAYKKKYGFTGGEFPESEMAASTLLCLPMHPYLTDEEVKSVISAIRQFFS